MTREEAIEIVKSIILCGEYENYGVEEEAVDMAIDALKQPEIRYCKDCMYYDRDTGHCDMHTMMTDPTDYCSYSVRR